MSVSDVSGLEPGRKGSAARPHHRRRPAKVGTNTAGKTAIEIVATASVLLLIMFGALALRLVLALPHSFSH